MLKTLFFTLLISTLSAEIIFKVSDVQPTFKPLKTWPAKDVVRYSITGLPEGFGTSKESLVNSPVHPVIGSIHEAFNQHRPLTLSPDIFWLLISQGVSKHINHNPEEMRDFLVDFSGQKLLRVRRDDFKKGSANNDWLEVLPEFVAKIKANSKSDLVDTLNINFSTTTPTIQAAYQISTMDTFKEFFEYEFVTECGIPSITLEGKPEDWKKLINNTKKLKKYKLDWWLKDIIPILDKIHQSSLNNIDLDFWRSIYKYQELSGGDEISGWIIKFFPYLEGKEKKTFNNPFIGKELSKIKNAIKIDQVPGAISRVPFEWKYYGETFKMEFIAGFIGINQSDDMSLKAEIAWAVREITPEEKTLQNAYPELHSEFMKTGLLHLDNFYLGKGEEVVDLDDIFDSENSSKDKNVYIIKEEDLNPFLKLDGVNDLSLSLSISDQNLSLFKKYKDVRSISLYENTVECGAFLKDFTQHKKLKSISLNRCSLKLDTLKILKNFPALEEIDFSGSNVPLSIMSELSQIESLKIVRGLSQNGQEFTILIEEHFEVYDFNNTDNSLDFVE